MAHSSVGPSSAERFFNCPGSVKAQRELGIEPPPNQAALEGTAIHEFAADCLKKGLIPEKQKGKRVKFKQGKNSYSFPIDDDFIFTVKMYIRYIDEVLKENNLTRQSLHVEVKFNLPEVDVDAHGTVDCAFIAGDTLYVIDLKSGRGILVDPEENKQCMYYALRPFFDASMFVRKVKIVIVQPRAKDGDFIKEWETTPDRLRKYAEELKEAIALTKVKDPRFEAGSHCKFCKAAGLCHSLQKNIMKAAQSVVPSLDKIFPPVNSLNAEQIGKALPMMTLLKTYMEALESYAYALLMDGQEVPNYVLTRSSKQRRWNDEESVKDDFYGEFGDDIYAERKLRSPAQMEKLIGKEKLKDYIIKPEGDLKITMTKDAEDAVKRTAEEVFKNVKIEQ